MKNVTSLADIFHLLSISLIANYSLLGALDTMAG